jgi:hypothetical protein
MAMIDFAFRDQHRIARLYQSYLEAGGFARISGYGAFTMVIAQFGHFWESAITTYVAARSTPSQLLGEAALSQPIGTEMPIPPRVSAP